MKANLNSLLVGAITLAATSLFPNSAHATSGQEIQTTYDQMFHDAKIPSELYSTLKPSAELFTMFCIEGRINDTDRRLQVIKHRKKDLSNAGIKLDLGSTSYLVAPDDITFSCDDNVPSLENHLPTEREFLASIASADGYRSRSDQRKARQTNAQRNPSFLLTELDTLGEAYFVVCANGFADPYDTGSMMSSTQIKKLVVKQLQTSGCTTEVEISCNSGMYGARFDIPTDLECGTRDYNLTFAKTPGSKSETAYIAPIDPELKATLEGPVDTIATACSDGTLPNQDTGLQDTGVNEAYQIIFETLENAQCPEIFDTLITCKLEPTGYQPKTNWDALGSCNNYSLEL